MIEKLAPVIWQIAVAFLDRYLDAQIDRVKDPSVKDKMREVENIVVSLLEGPLGTAIARSVARAFAARTLDRWFQNDPTTRTWG